jgi:hypothetical protein
VERPQLGGNGEDKDAFRKMAMDFYHGAPAAQATADHHPLLRAMRR